jgi:hypothetical protein
MEPEMSDGSKRESMLYGPPVPETRAEGQPIWHDNTFKFKCDLGRNSCLQKTHPSQSYHMDCIVGQKIKEALQSCSAQPHVTSARVTELNVERERTGA